MTRWRWLVADLVDPLLAAATTDPAGSAGAPDR